MQVFPLASTQLALQMGASLLIIQILSVFGLVSLSPWNWKRARQLLPITLLYTANTGFALAGLKSLNIPMYNALKRLSPILVLILKAAMGKKPPSLETVLSVLLIVSGCIVAAAGDLSFDLFGYCCALLSCVLQASYLLLVEVRT